MGMTPEKKVQNTILKYLQELEKNNHPIFFERRQAGGLSYKEGIPDVYCVYGGLHIEIEVKAPGGQPSARQEAWERKFKKIGAIYIRTDNLKKLKDFFEKELIPSLYPEGVTKENI